MCVGRLRPVLLLKHGLFTLLLLLLLLPDKHIVLTCKQFIVTVWLLLEKLGSTNNSWKFIIHVPFIRPLSLCKMI